MALMLVGLVSLILVPVTGAATWTVHADGSGDFPTIQAAVLASANGDVIELAPGTYTGPGNTDVNITDLMITLRSQSGLPGQVFIDCNASSSAPRRGLLVVGDGCSGTLIEGLTIIANCPEGEAIWAPAAVPVQISCSDLYGNAGGDWIGAFASQVDQDGNFSANPCFCSPDTDEFTLCEDSFCLPGHHPWGCNQLVGAFGLGCGECSCSGPVSTDQAHLGSIKAMYR